METLLSVRNLSVAYKIGKKDLPAVSGINLDLNAGDSLAIVGESGCGKSTFGLSIPKLLPAEAVIKSGEIYLRDKNILLMNDSDLKNIRGGKIAYVFQDPLSCLNPVIKIEEQIRETLESHGYDDSLEENIIRLLSIVKLRDADRVSDSYPHQLSGGQRQRVMIAQALSCNPELLIADEPTTALDVTTQGEILGLLSDLISEFRLTLIFITHNFQIIGSVASKIAVMYAGEIVEEGNTSEVFKSPGHPYTRALISIIPKNIERLNRFNAIPGDLPDLSVLRSGCRFFPRCSSRTQRCEREDPVLIQEGNRKIRCFNPCL